MNADFSFLYERGDSSSLPHSFQGKVVKAASLDGPPDAPADGGSLPCLNSNNSTESVIESRLNLLSGYNRRQGYLLRSSVEWACKRYGIERLGFLTLTFGDHVINWREAQRRFNSLATHFLRNFVISHVVVMERQKSGRIHYHLLVVFGEDIRTGSDFTAFENRDYRSANSALRSRWKSLRDASRRYGFGRTELLPVKSNSDGISKYVGKYLEKGVQARRLEDKHARLVRYSKGFAKGSCKFGWVSPRAWLFRQKVAAVAREAGVSDLQAFKEKFGSRWAYKLQNRIISLDLVASNDGRFTYPSAVHAQIDGQSIIEDGCFTVGPVTICRRVEPIRKFDGFPVWNISRWDRRKEKIKRQVVTVEAQQRAKESGRALREFSSRASLDFALFKCGMNQRKE